MTEPYLLWFDSLRLGDVPPAGGKNGLQIYMMCEIPNNVIQADAFAAVFDGFSIGSV